jgi:hypothetical protein
MKSPRYPTWGAFGFLALLIFPGTARADAGIPMLPFAYPVILVLLIPVIAIEASYLRFRLRTDWRTTIIVTSKANLQTMLLRFPLMWVIYLGIELVLWVSGAAAHLNWAAGNQITKILIVATSAAWMGPVEERWAIPFAFVVLLIPSFFLSGFVESKLINGNSLHCEGKCSRTVWQANVLSYIFLAITGGFALWKAIGRK